MQAGGQNAPFFDANFHSAGSPDEVYVRAFLLDTSFVDEAQRAAYIDAILDAEERKFEALGSQWARHGKWKKEIMQPLEQSRR